MDESFDAKLIKRLRNYSEEPRLELWQQIAGRARANPLPVNGKRLRSMWVLILGVIAVGGLLYLQTTKSKINAAAGLSASVSSFDKSETGDVSSGSAISKDNAPRMNDVTSSERAGNNITPANRNNVTNADDKGWLKHEPAMAGNNVSIAGNKISAETNAKHDEAKFDEALDEDLTNQVNETANPDKRSMEKILETKSIKKAENNDEGETVIREKKKKQNKFSIYFTIMPTFGYQRINSNSSDD
ncbi:MAG TPA: hypothetical protein VF141_10565, partial [Chryseolinea sp.]